MYFLRRLLLLLPVALLSSVLVFAVLNLLPGDVALSILGDTPHTEEVRETLRAELGLDDPLPVQYLRWLRSILSGGYGGQSLQMRVPIRSLVREELPVTLLISLYTIVISVLVSVPLGVFAASRRGRPSDLVIRVTAAGGIALPHVWIALLLLLLLLRAFAWSPPIIYSRLTEFPGEHFALLIWPVLLLSWQLSSHLIRTIRTSVAKALTSLHTQAARARGVPEARIVWIHAAREAIIPAVTVLALDAAALLGGTIVLEVIFGIPGIGRRLVDAAVARDFPVVQSVSFLLVLIVFGMNLVVDAVYMLADPRVRRGAHR